MKTDVKYMKTWIGVITGSLTGWNDGFPEIKYRLYKSIEEMADDYGKHSDEKHYQVESVEAEVQEIINKRKEEVVEMNKLKEKRRIELEIKLLQEKLHKFE